MEGISLRIGCWIVKATKNVLLKEYAQLIIFIWGEARGVNVRPNPRTRHKPDTGFFGLELGFNGFGS